MRFTPDNITRLAPDEIFVFASNIQGIHGAGAAKTAARLFHAKSGTGFGFTGQCYAIPTRSYNGARFRTLSLGNIRVHVTEFLEDARSSPDKTFLVTKIGCGYAGLNATQIAPMFKGHPANVILPKEFHDILHENTTDRTGSPEASR